MNLPQSSGNREKKNDGGEVMSVYKVEICGVNTSRLPLLKNEEKEALFQRIRNGDEEARQEYIKGNLRLVLTSASLVTATIWTISFRSAVLV